MIRHCYYDKTDNTIHNVVVEEDYEDIGLRYHLMDYSWDIDLENTQFYYEDNDTAVFEFELERENLLNDFYTSKTYHRGSIVLKKTSDNDIQISIQQNSTSKETLEVNNIIMSEIKEKLHNKSIIKSNAFQGFELRNL